MKMTWLHMQFVLSFVTADSQAEMAKHLLPLASLDNYFPLQNFRPSDGFLLRMKELFIFSPRGRGKQGTTLPLCTKGNQ